MSDGTSTPASGKKRMRINNLEEAFWARVDKRGPDECWPWTGTLTKKGYGQFWRPRMTTAHRMAYQLHHGITLPPGHEVEIDHVKDRGCTRRDCCNPAHLEAVTPGENHKRGTIGEVTTQRCKGVPLTAEHRAAVSAGMKNAKRDTGPRSCECHGRVFMSAQALSLHLAHERKRAPKEEGR
jgi:HNH endonuclease